VWSGPGYIEGSRPGRNCRNGDRLSFVALVVVEGGLLWRLLHLNRGAEKKRAVSPANDFSTNELNPGTARALQEPLEPVMSVTEQSTRALEPSYDKGERRGG
jgi:hypothetical protein